MFTETEQPQMDFCYLEGELSKIMDWHEGLNDGVYHQSEEFMTILSDMIFKREIDDNVVQKITQWVYIHKPK